MDKRVTIQDVARHAGVSITTVSRFLNERYDSMSEATRGRIEAVIRDLGYRPNALAQGLKGNRTKIVAAVVVNMSYPFCVGFMRSLNQTLSPAGYHLFVSETAGNPDRERAVVQSLQAQRVDAMVLQTGGQNNDLLAAIATQMPVIFVDRKYSVPGVTNVITNNREASEQLTAHILEQGYRRVLYVTEEEDGVHTRKERLQGYLQACHKRSIKPWVITVDRDQKDTFDVVVNAVEDGAKKEPIAVYTGNGLLMMRLYPALVQLGYQVPNQLGLATFDQPDWSGLVQPSLTCVGQPVDTMGALTGEMLLQRLGKPDETVSFEVKTIASNLVFGGSTRLHG
ncbi:LacI family transcriptional regulator [Alicyclobacillus fastidiosus]|uniref:LacI family transcriptional regulator n=1 Tax=Alicyclobacillus fastidiosus TaxID=392011 RepID=A0ABY6ZGC4_9BACL|nr:LacI family DNA-binding transcriptional regulator [Alicyclobacillus fastidiosus]WAH41892.1 LacI family transcriptional regulator [Alicyclobacillus fastidiosus]